MSALTPIAHAKLHANAVQPALMNTDLLSREGQSISLLLSLLVRLLYLDLIITINSGFGCSVVLCGNQVS